MKVTQKLIQQCYQRVLDGETVTDVATSVGITPPTLSRHLLLHAESLNEYHLYKQAIQTRKELMLSQSMPIARYDDNGQMIKEYSSIAQASKDIGLPYYKLKQLALEGTVWKFL